MRKEREEERHRDGETKERYKTLARALVKSPSAEKVCVLFVDFAFRLTYA